MFPSVVVFLMFVGVESSFSYPPFNAINHHPRMENTLESDLSSRRAIQSNRVVECEWEDIYNAVGLEELQELIEAIATRKNLSPFAILRTLNRRMKNKEEIEESILNAIEGASLPDPLGPTVIDLPPPPKMSPMEGKAPYSLPPNMPMNTGDEEETKVIIIPVAPPAPNKIPVTMKQEVKPRKDTPMVVNNVAAPNGKIGHMIPGFFPLLSPIKSNHLRPPLGATVRVDSGDPLSPISRDITVTVSPLMTLIEALRQAEIKYQNVLGLNHDTDVITFAHSPTIDCYIINRIDDLAKREDSGWKVTIMDRDGQVVYDNFCLPSGKEVLVKPGTLISLTYTSL